MDRLGRWSGRRIAAAWLGWFGMLAVGGGVFVGVQWRRQGRPPQALSRADSAAIAGAESAAVGRDSRPRLRARAEQHTDVVISWVAPGPEATLEFLGLVFGPPAGLTALWLVARQRRGPAAPA